MSLPLEPDRQQVEALNQAVMAYAARFLSDRPSAPASAPPLTPELMARLRRPPPEEGAPIETLLATVDRAVDTGFDTASGRFLSFIPSGGLYAAALGAFLGAVTNRFTGAAHASPGAVALEQGVIDWMVDLFGLPPGASGVLFSGGSIANLTAVVAARTQLGDDFGDGVVYLSVWAHHSMEKAARLAGIASRRIRTIPVDRATRLDPGALDDLVRADLDAGLRPMLVAATAGGTDTGAVDPLEACARTAAEAGAWFHVDAAYGGFFQLTDRGRNALTGIEAADSITVDAHKSLLLPFGVGGLVVRDGNQLVSANEGRGVYMQDVEDSELPHFTFLGPELTRPNRGLMMWLALHLHGVAPFRRTLDDMLDLAAWAAAEIEVTPGLELACPPSLSIVVFRSVKGDDATRSIFDEVNRSGAAHLSSTTVDDRFAIRLAFLSQRTTESVAHEAINAIRLAVRE